MFLLKKIVAPFLMPLSVVLLLAGVGLVFLWFTRKQKTGKVLVTASFGLLGLLSYGAVSDRLIGPLESVSPPLGSFEGVQHVKWIVVLSGGSGVDQDLPLSTYLTEPTLRRLSEGVFLYRRIPGSRLVVSGRSPFSGITPAAEVMAEVAEEWGVKAGDVVVEAESRDTKDHAVFIKAIVGKDPFILVTSASHMPRALALFRGQGMDPIPAPTDYMLRKGELRPGHFFPNAGALGRAERAVHEFLGLVWGKVRGQI